MKNAYVFLADGFEDVEAVTPIDYLRRAGVKVMVVGVTGTIVVSAHQLPIVCDVSLDLVLKTASPDLIVLPGGSRGAENLAASKPLRELVVKIVADGGHIGAICAAPAVVLAKWGYLSGKKWTCYPGCGDHIAHKPIDCRVITDGNLTTASGPGVAEEFSLELIRQVCGEKKAYEVSAGILAR